MFKPSRILPLTLLVASVANLAGAATDTTTFDVTLTITESCDIQTAAATDVAFGSQVRSGSAHATTGSLTVNCSSGTPYTIGLSNGSNFSGTRRMNNGGVYVPYELYKEAGHSNRWGNAGGELVSGTGNAANQTLTVYGNVPSLDFAAGTYTDTITATVTY